ncbi:response regulator transcription factor [Calothrix sp. PCC 6303]|uniref:response regulator transcription factor n=1 Tax=Calothrix sp. PCC 6303 TaxID=1170562 RepID=UPI0002A04DB2|nr:response regulator [Calothrix sp. PCC 6303]AFZ01083.1 response regulator receiver protein [Calothrix sp. PCC 6303]
MSRILIAEDEERIAAFIEKGLINNGFQVAIADNGEAALQMLEDDAFDLLLLDMQLPIKSGWIVLEKLQAQKKYIPIIIISAYFDAREVINKLPNQNIIDYVAKPFRFADLLMRIQNSLRLSNSYLAQI